VAVAVADFLAPRGTIEPALFPLESEPVLAARLNEYLTQGQQNVAGLALTQEQADDAVRSYVYYRSYDAIVDRIVTSPNSVSFADQGSVSYSSAQIQQLAAKRDRYLDDYTAILAAAGTVTNSGPSRDSVTIPVRVTW